MTILNFSGLQIFLFSNGMRKQKDITQCIIPLLLPVLRMLNSWIQIPEESKPGLTISCLTEVKLPVEVLGYTILNFSHKCLKQIGRASGRATECGWGEE